MKKRRKKLLWDMHTLIFLEYANDDYDYHQSSIWNYWHGKCKSFYIEIESVLAATMYLDFAIFFNDMQNTDFDSGKSLQKTWF